MAPNIGSHKWAERDQLQFAILNNFQDLSDHRRTDGATLQIPGHFRMGQIDHFPGVEDVLYKGGLTIDFDFEALFIGIFGEIQIHSYAFLATGNG